MNFFIDYLSIPTQTSGQAFGPLNNNSDSVYNTCSKFTLQKTAKAFACQAGTIIIQQSKRSDSLVNAIIKPSSSLLSSSIRASYYVYRGILKESLIANDSIISKNLNTNNELVKRIYNSDVSKINFASQIIGYDNTISDDIHIEKLFWNQGILKAHSIKEGEWFGDFAVGEVSFEVVLESDKFNVDLGFVRNTSSSVDVSNITSPLAKRIEREKILNFIDPAALYGLYSQAGVNVRTGTQASIPLKRTDLYTLIISKFYTKNYAYIDIRNERGYSYNFYQNYNGTNNNIRTGNSKDQLSDQIYGVNSWPILRISNSQITSEDTNAVWFTLRIDDNVRPLLYDLNLSGKTPFFLKVKGSSLEWSDPFQISLPNTILGNSKINISTYFKFYYFRRQATGRVQDSVPKVSHFYNSAFCSINLPLIGDLSTRVRTVSSPNHLLIEEALSETTGFGNFCFASSSKAVWDNTNILFYSHASSTPFLSSDKKFLPTSVQRLTCINTTVSDITTNLSIICRSYHKIIPGSAPQEIKIIGVNKYSGTYTNNKDNAIFLGITRAELAAMKAATGLLENSDRRIYLKRTTNEALRDRGQVAANRFYEYKVLLQGIDNDGTAKLITPASPDSNGSEILVYTRDHLFFSSPSFSTNEIQTDGPESVNRVEFRISSNGNIIVNDNIDLGLIAGDQQIFYLYNNTLITQLNVVLANKMRRGDIQHVKLSVPPTGFTTLTQDYRNDHVDARLSYENSSHDVFSVGHYGTDENYQVIYRNLHKKTVLVQFDNNVLVNGERVALHINYGEVNVNFKYAGTMRRYAQPDLAAAIIGALIQINMNLVSYGFSFKDSTCFPSQTHNNGEAMDTQYKPSNVDEQTIINALRHFGLTYILKGQSARFASLTGAQPFPHHDSHLHSGGLIINTK